MPWPWAEASRGRAGNSARATAKGIFLSHSYSVALRGATPGGSIRRLHGFPGRVHRKTRRSLYGTEPSRVGRYGRAVHRPPGGRGRVREGPGPEDAAGAVRHEPARAADVPGRGPPGREAEPPEHRPHVR